MTAAWTAGYEDGKNEGYDKGYSAGWDAGREKAAEWLESQGFMHERGTERHRVLLAGDIRKLKKP